VSPVSKERVDAVRTIIHDVIGGAASPVFLGRVDAILTDWAADKFTAAQACEKVQKIVTLFIDEDKAREIGARCAPIVMRESANIKK
jgi:hypothetical protein